MTKKICFGKLKRQSVPLYSKLPPPRTDVFAFVTEPWRLSSLSTGATPPPKIPPGWRQPWRLSDLSTVADSPWGGGEFAVEIT